MSHKSKVFGEAFDGDAQERIGEAMTGANTYYSLPVRLPYESGLIAFQAGWDGTLSGAFTAWFTTQDRPDLASDTGWNEDAAFAAAASDPAGAPGGTFVPGSGVTGGWWRVKYVNASGAGNMWAFVRTGR
jgi:hypothetical protein